MEHRYRYYKYKKVPKYQNGGIDLGPDPFGVKERLKNFYNNLAFSSPASQKIANQKWQAETNGMHALKNSVVSAGIGTMTGQLGESFANALGNDTDAGRVMGSLFSTGISSIGNTMAENTIKGAALTEGLGKNTAGSLAGAGAGIAANYLGQGITSALGDSRLARGIGAGVATGLGTVGGTVLGNLASTGSILGKSSALFGSTANTLNAAKEVTKYGAAINPIGLGMSVVGSALGSALGPSKEYAGKYGGITQTMDTVYDLAQVGVNAIPGAGQIISGAMALNKGLSNIFGSTDGMTKTDAILGSAFMPAPIKWLNMWGSSTTGTFNNQSWQNSEKTSKFMQDGFGNLQSRFDQARAEAGKTYGTFSQGAKRRAQANIDYANAAWGKVLKMADQNALQNIKSQDMSSINNQRYAQMIQGGSDPRTLIGRQGMKILNNATNHNIGMRLLSGAALIDNKQMILCNVPD